MARRRRSTASKPPPKQPFRRIKYPKHEVESLFSDILFTIKELEVPLIAWPTEQIAQYTLNKNSTEDHVYLPQRNKDEPAKKKQKLIDVNDKSVLKLVLSKGDTVKSQFKTSINNDKENEKPNKNGQINDKKSDQDNSVGDIVNISTNCEISDKNMAISNESIQSASSSNGKLHIRDMNKLVKHCLFENFCDVFLPNTTKNNISKLSILPLDPILTKAKSKERLTVNEVEYLYRKYFSKSLLDNIVIIGNILHIIFMSTNNHRKRMENLMKIKPEGKTLRERCGANKIYLKHNKILVSELKKNLLCVILQFSISDFEPAFQMVFLSIITVLRVLKSPVLREGQVFKNVVSLMRTSLKKNYLSQDSSLSTVFALFRLEKKFRYDCVHIITIVEDHQVIDPEITDRVPIFFVLHINGLEYFQVVIDSVTSYSNEDLELLIDKAAIHYKINSTFKSSTDFPSSSTVNKNNNLKMPVSPQNTSIRYDSTQHVDSPKTPNGISQHISLNVPNSKNKSPAARETRNGNFNKLNSSSNSKVSVTAANVVSKISVPISTVTSSPNMSTVQGIKSSTIPKGSTIVVNDRRYTFIGMQGNQKQVAGLQDNMLSIRKPEDITAKCASKNCQKSPLIMCSICRRANYCSETCQRLDWYETHIFSCKQMGHQPTPDESNEY